MAKKQSFGEEAAQRKGTHRRMAKVIISTKTTLSTKQWLTRIVFRSLSKRSSRKFSLPL